MKREQNASVQTVIRLGNGLNIRFTLNDNDEPVTGLVTQYELDDAIQEAHRLHMQRHGERLQNAQLVETQIRLDHKHPESDTPTVRGLFVVVTTHFHEG